MFAFCCWGQWYKNKRVAARAAARALEMSEVPLVGGEGDEQQKEDAEHPPPVGLEAAPPPPPYGAEVMGKDADAADEVITPPPKAHT